MEERIDVTRVNIKSGVEAF